MSWFKQSPKRHPQKLEVQRLQFLGEQDGPPERELKGKLSEFFRRDQSVKTAYLAKVSYREQTSTNVALCLRTLYGSDPGMAEKIGRIFSSMFGEQEHMDIVFLNEAQDTELAKICNPFFHIAGQ